MIAIILILFICIMPCTVYLITHNSRVAIDLSLTAIAIFVMTQGFLGINGKGILKTEPLYNYELITKGEINSNLLQLIKDKNMQITLPYDKWGIAFRKPLNNPKQYGLVFVDTSTYASAGSIPHESLGPDALVSMLTGIAIGCSIILLIITIDTVKDICT